ncbi:shikimate dehydrogenase [Effusibacillus dendaii]|uniref:Shikimate dehydrogenase (NADP(+)) n=1 Tax=Effusibacillus dendaii TaxID=2743772 RepID=A0A7I8DEU2_9BACL|nr:shikimate dehydrogenase [Effusibacillus dendaii]BCJ88557.1 shikimate dehydrogenase (NADP(+)) [Effusibacillus dendaii]
MNSNGHLTLIGLFGHPIHHSRSPLMQNAAFRAKGLPYTYVAFDVFPEQLKTAAESIRILGMRGVNVTIPHKVDIMACLDELSPAAKLIGAVNTVVNEKGTLIGHNTDGSGYVRSLLEETRLSLPDANVLVLGAGGAARAVAAAMALQGAKRIQIVNRTPEKGRELAERLGTFCPAEAVSYQDLPELVSEADLLVNTTSVGMHPNEQEIPLPPDLLHEKLVVSDLIYNPRQTRLLWEAAKRGAKTHGGLGMFIYQGAEAFTLWTGEDAPVELMRKTIESSL